MNSKLYVTYDKIADSYGPLMEFPTLSSAIRAIGFQVSKNETFRREDFQLIELGSRIESIPGLVRSPEDLFSESTIIKVSVYDEPRIYEFTDILPDVAVPQSHAPETNIL